MARTYYKIIQRKSDGFYKTTSDWSELLSEAQYISSSDLETILNLLPEDSYIVLEGLIVS